MSIKFDAFMTVYKHKKNDDDKLNFVKEHIKNEYIPYERKADVARSIANQCYKDSDGNFHVDSIAKYMLTCMAMFELYTDIERSKVKGSMLDDFNLLNEYGILDSILSNVNPKELKEFNMVVQLTCDDMMANEFDAHAFFSKQVGRFGDLIGSVLEPIVSKMDMDKIEDVVNNLNLKLE